MRTGLATWAWNTLHANFFAIFWFLIGRGQDGTKAAAYAVWHAVQNDLTQRGMLKGVAKAELSGHPKLLAHIEWALVQADTLSIYRNIAVHTPAIFSMFMVQLPSADPIATKTQTLQRFNQIEHAKFWRLLSGDLHALSSFTGQLVIQSYRPDGALPLPYRPKLRSLALIDRIEGQIGQLAQSEAQALQKPSSLKSARPKKLSAAQRRKAAMSGKG